MNNISKIKPLSNISPLSETSINRLSNITPSLKGIQKIQPLKISDRQPNTPESVFVDYNNPDQINSIADVLTRTSADNNPTGAIYGTGFLLRRASDILPELGVITGSVSLALRLSGLALEAGALASDKDFWKYVKDYYITPATQGNWSAVGYNALQGFSETADLLAQPVKAFMPAAGGSAQAGMYNLMATAQGALGIKSYTGRSNYDYDTGNIATDMALELISDPMNFIDIAGGVVKYSAKAKEGVDAISKFGHKIRKGIISSDKKILNKKPIKKIAKAKSEKYIAKRTYHINKNFDKLKQNTQDMYVKKWLNISKNETDPYYKDPNNVLRMLETGRLDPEYKPKLEAIERARKMQLEQLHGTYQAGIVPGRELGGGWRTVEVYDSAATPNVSKGPAGSPSASEAIASREYEAQSYIDMIDNMYTPDSYKSVDVAEDKVKQLQAMPDRLKNNKVWQNAYSKAIAVRDKARTEVRLNASQHPGAALLSEDNFNKLKSISVRPSDNKELLNGVGGTTVKIIKTTSAIQTVANAIDKGVMHTATWKFPSTLWKGTKFVFRNAAAGVSYIDFVRKMRKTMTNSTEAFFKNYYTDEGYLDLSKFSQYYPEYARFVGRTDLYYKHPALSAAAESFFKMPTAADLTKRVKASVDHISFEIDKVLNSKKESAEQLNDLLEVFDKNFKDFFKDKEDLEKLAEIKLSSDISAKLELLGMYSKYLSTLASVDSENMPIESLQTLINKLNSFNDFLESKGYKDSLDAIAELKNKAVSIDNSFKHYTALIDTFRIRSNKIYNALADTLTELSRKYSDDIIRRAYDLSDKTVADAVGGLQSTFNAIDKVFNNWLQIPDYSDNIRSVLDPVKKQLGQIYHRSKILYNSLNTKGEPVSYGEILQYLARLREFSNTIFPTVGPEGSLTKYTAEYLETLQKNINNMTPTKGTVADTIQKHIDALEPAKKVDITYKKGINKGEKYTFELKDLFNKNGLFMKPIFSKVPEGDLNAFQESYKQVEDALNKFFEQAGEHKNNMYAAKDWLEKEINNLRPIEKTNTKVHNIYEFKEVYLKELYEDNISEDIAEMLYSKFEIARQNFMSAFDGLSSKIEAVKKSKKVIQGLEDPSPKIKELIDTFVDFIKSDKYLETFERNSSDIARFLDRIDPFGKTSNLRKILTGDFVKHYYNIDPDAVEARLQALVKDLKKDSRSNLHAAFLFLRELSNSNILPKEFKPKPKTLTIKIDSSVFSKVYNILNDLNSSKKILPSDILSISDMLKTVEALQEFIVPIQDTLYKDTGLLEAIELLSKNAVTIQSKCNLDPALKAYQVFFSGTHAYFKFITDLDIKGLFNDLSNPNKNSKNFLVALMAYFKEADPLDDSGEWLKNSPFYGYFKPGSEGYITEAFRGFEKAISDWRRQNSFVENIFSNDTFLLTNFEEGDLKRDYLKLLIVDTLNYYHDLNGADFLENFEEYFPKFMKRLQDNETIRLSKQAYNMDYLKAQWLGGKYAKQAAQFKNHDAASDCNILELIIEQWNDIARGVHKPKKLVNEKRISDLLFDEDPNSIDVILDTEFSIVSDITKGTSEPLQIAYKQRGSSETIDLRIKFEGNPDRIDSRTLRFFENAKGHKYTDEDFAEEWCKEGNPTRSEAFFKFFNDMRQLELNSGKRVRLIGHNLTAAEIPVLDTEYKRVRKLLVKQGSFLSLQEADAWYNSLKLNTVDTLAQMRLKNGLPTITPAQREALRVALSEYAVASEDSKHLTRTINNIYFQSLHSIRSSIKGSSGKGVFDENISARFGSQEDIYAALDDARELFSGALERYKSYDLKDYYFDTDIFKNYDIKIDGISIQNITQFNSAVGTISYFGFRRISTPELYTFFKDDIVRKTMYNSKYIRLVEQLYEQMDKIRYPEHLRKYRFELGRAFFNIQRAAENLSKMPGYASRLGYFKYFKNPENIIERFVLVRKMYNRLNAFAERNNETLDPAKFFPDEELYKLISGEDSRLYVNDIVEDLSSKSPAYEHVDELDRIQKFYRRAWQCCENDIERLNEVSSYLESVNKTNYDRFTRAKTTYIDTQIRPYAEKFSELSKEELKEYAELFYKIPQNQLDNRFLNFNTPEQVTRLSNELLYNPLHTMIISKAELQKYGDIAQVLAKYNTIKYKEVGDWAYLYLDKDFLNKFTFHNGVPYLVNKIARTTYKSSIEDSVPDLVNMRRAITNLYELDEDYFSDSCGRTFSEKQLREIYDMIPEEIQNELPDIEHLVDPSIFKNGPVINNILLGEYHRPGKILYGTVDNPVSNYLASAQYCVKDLSLRTQWLHYFFDNTDGLTLALGEDGRLMANTLLVSNTYEDISDLCAALEVNGTYTLVALIPNGEKVYVRELPIASPTAVKKILDSRKIPIRLMTKAEALTVQNIVERPMYSKLQKAWNFGIRLFKNAALFSLGTFLRNAMDTFLKTTIDIGLGNTMSYAYEAHKLRKQYNQVIELVSDTSFTLADGSRTRGLLSEKALELVFAPGHEALLKSRGITIDYDTFKFIHDFKQSGAAAAMHKHQEAQIRYSKAFLNSAEYKANPHINFDEWLKEQNRLKNKLKKGKGLEKIQNGAESLWGTYNSVLSMFINPSSYIEDVNRLAMYLKYSDDGLLTKNAIFQKIKDTHFDFNYKTNITSKIEQFIPFYNFTKENASYWMRILDERPDVLKIISDVMTPILDLDSYNVEELERNRSLTNAITRGYIRLDEKTNLMLKANPSFLDAFMLFANPVEAFKQGCIINTPESLDALTKWEGGWKDVIINDLNSLVPWAPTIAQRLEAVSRNQERLTKQFESNQTPFVRRALNRAAGHISSTFTVPARYRNAKYTSGEYYKHWRNYRSPVKSTYTRTGISKLKIMMEPVSPDNIRYKLGVMQSYVNKQ